MATLFQILRFFDANGAPLSFGKIFWYEAGTSTKKDTWRDQGEVQAHTNPIILNNDGTIPDGSGGRSAIWLKGSYKLVISPSTDTDPPINPIITQDVINEYDSRDWTGLTATIADLNSTTTTTLSKNTTYAIVIGDRNKTVLANATSAPFTINLPAAATVGNKFRIYIKKVDVTSNAVTIDGSGTEKIDGQTTFELNDYNDIIGVHCDGSNWHLISSQIRGTVLAKSSVYPVVLNDYSKLVICNASGGAFNVTLPAINAVGSGFRVAIKKTDATTNGITVATPGAETIDGAIDFIITDQYNAYEFETDGANWFIRNDHQSGLTAPFPKGHFYGVVVENDTGDLIHDIKFNVGAARDEANTTNLILNTAIVKRLDGGWTQGTGQGGLANTLSPETNTWYHMFLFGKADGTTDAGFDKAVNASNLIADVGPPWTVYRRVGAFLTDASANILAFYNEGNYFYWNHDTNSISGTPAVWTTLVVTAPLGVITRVFISGDADAQPSGSIAVRFRSIKTSAVTQFHQNLLYVWGSGAEQVGAGDGIHVLTDTSSQIQYYVLKTGVAAWTGYAYGWEELRIPGQ